MSDESDVPRLRTVADYQFGAGAGGALFPAGETVEISRSKSGRPRQIHAGHRRLVTYGTDGRFTLGLEGGRRLVAALSPPAARVVVGDESAPFVRDGRNAFAKFVREVDDDVRIGDEVAVVLPDDTVLGVGRAELGADAMRDFDTGMAVKVRAGAADDDRAADGDSGGSGDRAADGDGGGSGDRAADGDGGGSGD